MNITLYTAHYSTGGMAFPRSGFSGSNRCIYSIPSSIPPTLTNANFRCIVLKAHCTQRDMEHNRSEKNLCSRMRLWELPDQYIIEPTDGGYHQLLSISRADGTFRPIVWANHGDEISIQYSGTPALKGDFDAIDLLQGHYAVSRDITSPFQAKGVEAVASLRLASVFVLAGIMLATMSLRQARQDARGFLFSAFWASLALGVMTFVRINGRMFCNRPRLQKLL